MIINCDVCGVSLLTEADPYGVCNTHEGEKLYCLSCFIDEYDKYRYCVINKKKGVVDEV